MIQMVEVEKVPVNLFFITFYNILYWSLLPSDSPQFHQKPQKKALSLSVEMLQVTNFISLLFFLYKIIFLYLYQNRIFYNPDVKSINTYIQSLCKS